MTPQEWLDTVFQSQDPVFDAEPLHTLVEAQTDRTPDATAIVFGAQTMTFAQLEARANQVAAELSRVGVRTGEPVGTFFERGIEVIPAILGVLKAGAMYAPVDPMWPVERIKEILRDIEPRIVLSTRPLIKFLPIDSHTLALDEWTGLPEDERRRHVGVSGRDPACLLQTSGSTGKSKGAINRHGSLHNRILWEIRTYSLTATDVILQKAPLCFDLSIAEIFGTLGAGARLVLMQPNTHRDPVTLVETIRNHHATVVNFTPSALPSFLDALAISPCPSLRHIICAGEALPAPLADRCVRVTGARLHNIYGPTETAVSVTHWEWKLEDKRTVMTLGRPTAGALVAVLDDNLAPCPFGQSGQIFIGGPHVGLGYYRRPDLTNERFIDSPFAPGSKLYATGDLGRYHPDGTLEYLGRDDAQVKLRGFRIELGEVESALLSHEGITSAVAKVWEAVELEKRLIAYYVANTEISALALRRFLEARLPNFMVPSEFVRLDAIPLNVNGKADRKALPPPPSLGRLSMAPMRPFERLVAEAFLNHLPSAFLDPSSNFFDLGGDSIGASAMLEELRRQTGVRFPLRTFFTDPTVRALARGLTDAQSQRASDPRDPNLGQHAPILVVEAPPGRAAAPSGFAGRRFQALAQQCPGRCAFVSPDQQISFFELEQSSNLLTHHFLACGYPAGAPMTLESPVTMDALVVAVAALKLGARLRWVPASSSPTLTFEGAVTHHRRIDELVALHAPEWVTYPEWLAPPDISVSGASIETPTEFIDICDFEAETIQQTDSRLHFSPSGRIQERTLRHLFRGETLASFTWPSLAARPRRSDFIPTEDAWFVRRLRRGSGPLLVCVGDTRPLRDIFEVASPDAEIWALKFDGVHTWPSSQAGLSEHLDFYERALRRDGRNPLLVGFCLGGLVARALAERLSTPPSSPIRPSVSSDVQAWDRRRRMGDTWSQDPPSHNERVRRLEEVLTASCRHIRWRSKRLSAYLLSGRFWREYYLSPWKELCPGVVDVDLESNGHFDWFILAQAAQKWRRTLRAAVREHTVTQSTQLIMIEPAPVIEGRSSWLDPD